MAYITSTGILADQARSPIGDPKDIILPWLIGTMADNLLQGRYPFSPRLEDRVADTAA